MTQAILAYLQRAENGATIDELCLGTGLTAEAVWHALGEMSRCAWVIGCARFNRAPKFYATTRIGECEWCGLVDHALVAGMCPCCMARSSGLELLPSGPMTARLAPIPGVGTQPNRRGANP